MGAVTALTPAELSVTPGESATFEISVRNTGTVVDSFTLRPLGPLASWTTCEPAVVSLFPGQSGTAQVTVAPPLDADTPSGPVAVAVRVISTEDPTGSVVDEGVLRIGGVSLVTAELSPRTGRARGRRTSKYRMALDNRGNTPALVGFTGLDEEDAVDITFQPPELEVPAGAAAFCEVRVRATRRFWRGQGVTHRFEATAHPPNEAPISTRGALLQEAVLPHWLPKALALLLAALVVLGALWFTVLKPAVQDAATSAGASAAQQAVNAALENRALSSKSSGSGSGASTSAPPTSPAPAGPPPPALPPPAPFAQALTMSQLNLPAGSNHILNVTDLVIQNPAGDQGSVVINRAGQALLTLDLASFRNWDQHFITPIMVPTGKNLTMSVSCANPGGKACTPVALVSGMSVTTS
ncbi:MAG TPA: hypothetical protein VGM75_09070 [Pseudonocardiaceae bacterium]